MVDPVTELADRGRALPPEERVRLMDLLLESLQSSDGKEMEAAWDQEIFRRLQRVERGEAVLHDASEVLDEARRIAP